MRQVTSNRRTRRHGSWRLVYETHATSLDNERGLASGHFDVDLSPAGEQQAVALGERRRSDPPSLVLTSDLRRAWRTAILAFGDSASVVRDARLRECDYGELTRAPVGDVDTVRLGSIDVPFPGGESYVQATQRVHECLEDLRRAWPGGWVLVIGHRATHYALAHLLAGIPLREAITRPFRWQAGWEYAL